MNENHSTADSPSEFSEDQIAMLTAPFTAKITRTARRVTIGFIAMGLACALVLVVVFRLGGTDSLYLGVFAFGLLGALPAYIARNWTLSELPIAPGVLRYGERFPHTVKRVRRQDEKQYVTIAWLNGTRDECLVVLDLPAGAELPTMQLYVRPRNWWVGIIAAGELHVSRRNRELRLIPDRSNATSGKPVR